MKFSSNVSEIMKKKKMTIRELSDVSGLSTSTVTKARQGESISECRLSTLGHIADALGVKTKRLFDEIEDRQHDK